MNVESAVDKIIERTKKDIEAFDEFERAFNEFADVSKGNATNLKEVEQALLVTQEKIANIRTSILVGLGKLREGDLEEILSRYRNSATHIYNLLEAYAKYDPTYLQQAMEIAEDDTRQKAVEALPDEVKAEYRRLLD